MRVGSSNKKFHYNHLCSFRKFAYKKVTCHIYQLVQVTENYQHQKLLSLLTGKDVSRKLRYNKNILRLRTLPVFIKKMLRGTE